MSSLHYVPLVHLNLADKACVVGHDSSIILRGYLMICRGLWVPCVNEKRVHGHVDDCLGFHCCKQATLGQAADVWGQ